MNGRMTILACITGFLLDCMFGDPVWMYHPIRVIGNLISVLEKGLRKLLCSRIPASEQEKKNRREVLAGGILWILTVSLSFFVPAVLLFAAGKVHPAVRFLLETFWCYQIFAARCLDVYKRQTSGDDGFILEHRTVKGTFSRIDRRRIQRRYTGSDCL